MPQFTPVDRETVKDHADSMPTVDEVACTHAGLVIKLRECVEVDCIGGLFTRYGWIVDTVNIETRTVCVVPAGQPEVSD